MTKRFDYEIGNFVVDKFRNVQKSVLQKALFCFIMYSLNSYKFSY